MKKLLITSITAVCAVILIFYTGLWFWAAAQIRDEINGFVKEAKRKDITILTRVLEIGNYPFTPEVHFAGRLAKDNIVVDIPELRVQSFLLVGRPITIAAPQGLTVLEPADAKLWSLEKARIESVIPAELPETLTNEDLDAWKQKGGLLTLDSIELEKQTLHIEGNGFFMLDDNLQPAGELNAHITGHFDFLAWLQNNDYVETREALMAAAVLNGLSKTDKEKDQAYMDVALTLQNQTLFVGPLRLVALPLIHWGWRSQPDPLQ